MWPISEIETRSDLLQTSPTHPLLPPPPPLPRRAPPSHSVGVPWALRSGVLQVARRPLAPRLMGSILGERGRRTRCRGPVWASPLRKKIRRISFTNHPDRARLTTHRCPLKTDLRWRVFGLIRTSFPSAWGMCFGVSPTMTGIPRTALYHCSL